MDRGKVRGKDSDGSCGVLLKMKPKPPSPLWLPEGSVRSMLAIGTILIIGIMLLRQITVPDWMILWGGIIVRDYFNTRSS